MGYELTFHYHEKDEDGKLIAEENKTFNKSIGRRNAEVPLEQVAAVIMGQMARRDIYITNVEVFEYAKREVSFKETKGGVVIKGKKFSFDQCPVKADDCADEAMPTLRREADPEMPQLRSEYDLSEFADLSQFKPSLPPAHPGVPQQMPQFNPHMASQKVAANKRDPNVPIRHEVFRPNRDDYPALQRQGFKLTMNRPYPLFGEVIRNAAEPIYYVVVDDTGSKVEISSLYFEPMRRGLSYTGMHDPSAQQSEGRLAYVDYGSGVVDRGGVPVHQMDTGEEKPPPMPQLRRSW